MQKDVDKDIQEKNIDKENKEEQEENKDKQKIKSQEDKKTGKEEKKQSDYDKFDESDKFVDVHEDAAKKGATNFYKTKAERDIDEKYQKKQDEIEKTRKELKEQQTSIAMKEFLGLNNEEQGSFFQKASSEGSQQKQNMAQKISQDNNQTQSILVDKGYDERMKKAVAAAYQKEAQLEEELGQRIQQAILKSKQNDKQKNDDIQNDLKELDKKEKALSNDKKEEIKKLKQKDEKKRKQTIEGGSGGFIPIENIDDANENITPPSQVGGEKNKQTGLSY